MALFFVVAGKRRTTDKRAFTRGTRHCPKWPARRQAPGDPQCQTTAPKFIPPAIAGRGERAFARREGRLRFAPPPPCFAWSSSPAALCFAGRISRSVLAMRFDFLILRCERSEPRRMKAPAPELTSFEARRQRVEHLRMRSSVLAIPTHPSFAHHNAKKGASLKRESGAPKGALSYQCPHRRQVYAVCVTHLCAACALFFPARPPFGAHACGTRHRLLPRWLSSRTGFPAAAAQQVFLPLRQPKKKRCRG